MSLLKLTLIGLLISSSLGGNASSLPNQTPIEAYHFQKLPTHQEICDFLIKMSASSPWAQYKMIAHSSGNRPFGVMLISQDKAFLDSGQLSPKKLTVMLVGSQHGREDSGAEALQELIFSLLKTPLSAYLKQFNFVMVVDANPDGRDHHIRTNDANQNLNVNFVNIDQPETQALLALIRQYQPDAILDLHESSIEKRILKSEGFYTTFRTQFESANHPNLPAPLKQLMQDTLLPEMISRAKHYGLPASHYLGEIQQLNQPVAHGGLRLSNFRNYSAMLGHVSFLVENRLDPQEGNYPTLRNIKERRKDQYYSVLSFLDTLSRHQAQIRKVVLEVRAQAKHRPMHQKITYAYQYSAHLQKPQLQIPLYDLALKTIIMQPFANFEFVECVGESSLPKAYAITHHQELFEHFLKNHHILFKKIEKITPVVAVIPSISRVEIQQGIQYGRRNPIKIDAQPQVVQTVLKPGDLWVPTEQKLGILAALFLDVRAIDSLFHEPKYRHLLLDVKGLPAYPVDFPDNA